MKWSIGNHCGSNSAAILDHLPLTYLIITDIYIHMHIYTHTHIMYSTLESAKTSGPSGPSGPL